MSLKDYWFWHKGDVDSSDSPANDGTVTRALMDLLKVLSRVVSRETSSDSKNWTPENPLYGHCAVVALLVQEKFGGQFVRASLLEVEGYKEKGSHYWNLLPSGAQVDLTACQFKGNDRKLVPNGKTAKKTPDGEKEITRESLLEYEPTRKRYELLKKRTNNLQKELSDKKCKKCKNCKKCKK